MSAKFILFFSGLFFFTCFAMQLSAQDSTVTNVQTKEHNQGFIDEDGDGYNDNAPDHDGDGIPNGLDPDWQKEKKQKNKKRFVDLDGDGIDDNLQNNDYQQRKGEMPFHKTNSSLEEKGMKQKGQGDPKGQKKHGNNH